MAPNSSYTREGTAGRAMVKMVPLHFARRMTSTVSPRGHETDELNTFYFECQFA